MGAKLIKLTKVTFTLLYRHLFTILTLVLFVIISFRFEYFMYQKKYFILSSISLIFLMHLLSKVKFNIIFTVLFSFIVATNFYCAFELNTYLNAGLFGSIMDTNTAEAASMSKDILKNGIPMLLLSFLLIFMSMRELKNSIVPLKVSAIGLSVYLIFFLPYNANQYLNEKFGGMGTEISEHPLVVAEIIVQRTAPILYGNIATIVNYADERIKYRNFFNIENKVLAKGLTISTNSNDSLPQKIYLVIGESATRSHLSLYGYGYNTTPFVDSLAKNDSSFKAYNAYSSGTITRDAFRLALTAGTPHDINNFLKTKSIVDMANDIGYETVWLSPFEGVFRQHSGTYLQLLANSAQVFRYSPERDDLNYLKFIAETRNESKKQLILIGLNGSHGAYVDGTDKVDMVALPDDPNLSKMTNEYNRSIHHTDRFLKEMHKIMLQDSSAIMIYFSDHGEIIGKGHGMREGRAQIEIPFMTFNNSSIDLEALIGKYTFDKENTINSLTTFHIIAELMGYTVSEEERAHALKESKYVHYADRTVGLASEMVDGNNVNY